MLLDMPLDALQKRMKTFLVTMYNVFAIQLLRVVSSESFIYINNLYIVLMCITDLTNAAIKNINYVLVFLFQ